MITFLKFAIRSSPCLCLLDSWWHNRKENTGFTYVVILIHYTCHVRERGAARRNLVICCSGHLLTGKAKLFSPFTGNVAPRGKSRLAPVLPYSSYHGLLIFTLLNRICSLFREGRTDYLPLALFCVVVSATTCFTFLVSWVETGTLKSVTGTNLSRYLIPLSVWHLWSKHKPYLVFQVLFCILLPRAFLDIYTHEKPPLKCISILTKLCYIISTSPVKFLSKLLCIRTFHDYCTCKNVVYLHSRY